MLWNPGQTIERIEAAFEARMLRALQPRTRIEVPEDQYRRFEQFTVRFKSLVEHAGKRIHAVFRSPDSGNVAAIARVVQEEIRSIQSEIRDLVATAAAKGNGPVLEAMQSAVRSLSDTLSLADLEEGSIFNIVADLPSDAKLEAGKFFSIEKKPEPKLSATFDVSNPPNLWERMALEKPEQETTVPPFRWSWSDDELFCRNKTAQLRRCHRSSEQVMELWRETEESLFEGLAQWKYQCLKEVDPEVKFKTDSGNIIGLRQALNNIEQDFCYYVTGKCREAVISKFSSVFWGEKPLARMREHLETQLAQMLIFRHTPDPAFIRPALDCFFSILTQSEPVSMAPLNADHIMQSKSCYYCPGGTRAGTSRECVRMAMEKGFTDNKDIDDSILAAVHGMLGSGEEHDKNNAIVREAIGALRQQLSAVGLDIKDTILCQSRAELARFWKGVLGDALRIIESFHHPELSKELLMGIKNAASFHVAWNCRDSVLRVGRANDLPTDEAYLSEIHDFYPHPPEQEQASQGEDASAEAMPSAPLTREELLDSWGAAVDRMTVRLCKRGFIVMQDDSVVRIGIEEIKEQGIEIIEKYCSLGPVGKRRMRSLQKELTALVKFYDTRAGKQLGLRQDMQEIGTKCVNELQQMFATIGVCRNHSSMSSGILDTYIIPTLSSEYVRCILRSEPGERRTQLAMDERRMYTETIEDRGIRSEYDKWYYHVMSTLNDAFAQRSDRLSLDQCLEILGIFRRVTEQKTTWSNLVPDLWSLHLKHNQEIHEEIEQRLREKFAMAEPPKNEGRTEKLERIPREQLVGFFSSLRQKYFRQANVQFVVMSKTMERQTVARITDYGKLRGGQMDALATKLPNSLTLEECRSYFEQTRHIPASIEGIPNVPDEFRHLYEETEQSIDAEIERRLPELFHLSERSGLRLPKEVMWSIALDYWEAAAPERFTQAEYVALDSGCQETLQWCEQSLRKLYEDLPPRITRDDCHVFIHAARTTMYPLENAYPFPSSMQEEYKRSFDLIWQCAERSVDALFARQERQAAPPSARIAPTDEEKVEPRTSDKVSRNTLREWWNAVHEEAEKKLQVSVEDSAMHPKQVRKAVMDHIPSLPPGNGLASEDAASTFVEEVKRQIEHLPRTISVGGTEMTVPQELREFLLQQLTHLKQGFLFLGWQVQATPVRERMTGKPAIETTEAPEELSPTISSEEWENMIREEFEAISQSTRASDIQRQMMAHELSRMLPSHFNRFRRMIVTNPVSFPIRTRAELDLALLELRDCFSRISSGQFLNKILFPGMVKLHQEISDHVFQRIQGRAIRLLKDAGTPIGKQMPRRKAADSAPAATGTVPEGDSVVADPTERDTREDHAERISDLLTVYDVPQEQAVDRLSSAIADHVAQAATEALAAQAQTMSQEEFERAESELRKGIGLAAERAHAILSTITPGTLTEEHLSAALHGALEHATDGLSLSEAVRGSMRESMDENRSAIGKARTKEDLVEHIMERGEGGRGRFEETARMHRNAHEEGRRRNNAERARQSQRQITAGLERLTAIVEELSARAREGTTDAERQGAAGEAERLNVFLQTILGMYPRTSDQQLPAE